MPQTRKAWTIANQGGSGSGAIDSAVVAGAVAGTGIGADPSGITTGESSTGPV
jgi:hypothetical protein